MHTKKPIEYERDNKPDKILLRKFKNIKGCFTKL